MTNQHQQATQAVRGDLVHLNDTISKDQGPQRYYKIENVDAMAPFFISLISDQDHWLFAGSNGGLTMGRVSPDTAVFPYVTVDKLYESTPHTGPRTLFKVKTASGEALWEPFNTAKDGTFSLTRNIYKHELGHVLIFEEINHDLSLRFQYEWRFSDEFGIARRCELENTSDAETHVQLLDGLTNILPAGTPRFTQTQSSNLVDAYKWTELDAQSGLGLFTLYSAITDRAEPVEALRATTVFNVGLDNANIALSNRCIDDFIAGDNVQTDASSRGVRGAYFVNADITIDANSTQAWSLVVNVEQDQSDIVDLQDTLLDKNAVLTSLHDSYVHSQDSLARIMAASDGFQATGEPEVSLHHYANTLFNVLRGGIFADQYTLSRKDIVGTVKHFNAAVFAQHEEALIQLPEQFGLEELLNFAQERGDNQLIRIVSEYLPITFGRRHGDPSRPWNQFAIELKNDLGQPLLSYQGNWRDIFQNWEALCLSYPNFIETVIAKFVNASTVDGYNPYRITKQGIDWEVEEPDDPWSYIGYWGDHQIIYLLKLLEWSQKFHPGKLQTLFNQPVYSYANVPYRIKPYADLVANPKDTVLYDHQVAERIEQLEPNFGADAKMVLNSEQSVYQVNLLEKVLVTLLTKLSNLVIDGGIWLNTQRPEWNDANNALVGQGLSMVTLYYMNRYIDFMQQVLSEFDGQSVAITEEVVTWLTQTSSVLANATNALTDDPASQQLQFETLRKLGEIASEYRQAMYNHSGDFNQVQTSVSEISTLLSVSKQLLVHSIQANLNSDGLYHAYNTLTIDDTALNVKHLYPMLEGQVAALSSGALSGEQALSVLETLFASDIYRQDQKTFMLYPDRVQTRFLDKNVLPKADVESIELVKQMMANSDTRLVKQDRRGEYRFNADISNAAALEEKFNSVANDYPSTATLEALSALTDIHETVFNHNAFTGRSGGMFGFEGLGCIYWHMVSKLLLAAQECAVQSAKSGESISTTNKLIELYYRVREGIGFNKTPEEYGAFPTDPYSHTPKHAGAQQPGMTGQVKEELLTRLSELGCFVEAGKVVFNPFLLRAQEFAKEDILFRYVDVHNNWQGFIVKPNSLAFTWCQTPVVYTLDESLTSSIQITVHTAQGEQTLVSNELDQATTQALFARSGEVTRIDISIHPDSLFQSNR
jgi:hypothetical protein